MITTVIKRDGKTVPYDISFIKNAISKANVSLEKETSKINEGQINEVVSNIDNSIKSINDTDSINIESIQDIVQNSLIDKKYYDLVNAYISYRAERTRIRENKTDFMTEIIGKANPTEDTIANQNANVDEMSFGGRKGEADSVLMRRLALDHMSKKHRDNHLNNRVYIHDLDSYYVGMTNCLSCPFDDVLREGLEFRNTDLRPARSINTAFQLYMVMFQSQSLQQFGGVAGTHIDTTSIPYFRISFNKNYKSVQNILPFCKVNEALDETKSVLDKQYTGGFLSFRKKYIHKKALQMTIKELNQAAEGMYHNANSLLSRSGKLDCHVA